MIQNKIKKFIICSKECTQFIKGYCTCYDFNKICNKQKYLLKSRGKNNSSRKPYGKRRY